MRLLKGPKFLTALLITYLVSSLGMYAIHAAELPKYCESFPAIEGDLNEFKDNLLDRNASDVAYTLCNESQQVPVEVMDIMDHWSGIQEVQYDDRVKQFEEKLRKKVFGAVASSIYPYTNLYKEEDCQELSSAGRGAMGHAKSERQVCEEEQDFIPKCNNPEYQEILESKENDYHEFRDQEARQALASEGLENFSSEQVEEDALNEAHDYLDEQKKLGFMKSQLQNTILVDKLLKEREKELERFESEKTRILNSCTCIGRGCALCRDRKRRQVQSQLKPNHEIELSRIEAAIGKVYEQSPALLELENDINFSFSNLISTRYEKSNFAKRLKEKVLREKPDMEDMSLEETQSFISSLDGQGIFAKLSSEAIESNDSGLERLGRDKVFEEKRKKKEALEKLCQGDIDGLHHFSGIAESIIAESMQNNSQGNKGLVEDQAAYCYLLQTKPIGEKGGLGLGSILGASALVAGGVAVQVIPGLGQFAGAGALSLAAGLVGGGLFAVDSYDRYATSASRYESTQAAYHGSTAWADSVDLIESRDSMMTNAALAAAEVGLMAVDGALMIRPATSLAMKLNNRGITTTAKESTNSLARNTTDELAGSVTRPAARANNPPQQDRPLLIADTPSSSRSDDVVSSSERQLPDRVEGQAAQNPGESNRLESTNTTDIEEAPSVSAGRAQRHISVEESLERFRSRPFDEREEIAASILQKAREGGVEERRFLALVMQKGRYGNAFTPGVQNMARELMNTLGKGREQSLAVVRRFFEGKNSSSSLRKKRDLERLVDEIYGVDLEAPPQNLALTQTSDSREIVPANSSRELATTSGGQTDEVAENLPVASSSPESSSPRLSYTANRFDGAADAVDSTPSSTGGSGFFNSWLPETTLGRVGLGLGSSAIGGLGWWLNRDGEDNENEEDDGGADPSVEDPKIKVRLVGADSASELIGVEDTQVELKVEAYVDPDGEGELPEEGTYEWLCEGSDDICDDVSFNQGEDTQTLDVLERLTYTVKVRYVPEEPSSMESEYLTEEIAYQCETNADGTQCVSEDDEASRDTASDEEEEVLREPFWWESLPPNAPPPQFKPGPPMKMRTFILPGSI